MLTTAYRTASLSLLVVICANTLPPIPPDDLVLWGKLSLATMAGLFVFGGVVVLIHDNWHADDGIDWLEPRNSRRRR